MTDLVSTCDVTDSGSSARRQHAPADVAPELYDTTTDAAHAPAAESR